MSEMKNRDLRHAVLYARVSSKQMVAVMATVCKACRQVA